MDKDTRPKGWHDDFASDRPEHARSQRVAEERHVYVPAEAGNCEHCGEGLFHENHGTIEASFASPTGPDTRQADMVSRKAYNRLKIHLGQALRQWRSYAEMEEDRDFDNEMTAEAARYRAARAALTAPPESEND